MHICFVSHERPRFRFKQEAALGGAQARYSADAVPVLAVIGLDYRAGYE